VWHVHEEPSTDTRFAAGGGAGDPERLTSILVLPTGFAEQNLIWQEFYSSTEAQAVFPGQELGRLFELLRQGEQILTAVGWLVFIIAAMTVFLSIYSATLNREREIAIMRSLGSRRGDVFSMILFEAALLTLIGSLIGRVVGYGAALVIAGAYTQQSAVPVDVRYLTTLEPILWLVPLVIAGLAGLLPAVLAYKVDVAEKLTVV
jgi:putative ABC transport system permease protein